MVVLLAYIGLTTLLSVIQGLYGSVLLQHHTSDLHDYGSQTCPSWFVPQEDNGTTLQGCMCGDSLGNVVQCDQQNNRTSILVCFCMTCQENCNEVVVGGCLYTCPYFGYQTLPQDPSQLSNATCGVFNREGQLCGKCKTGHAQPVYSYSMRCVPCSDDGRGYRWMKYFAVALLPLTAFLLLVLTLRVNVAHGQLNVFVLICQLGLAAPQMRIVVTSQELGNIGDISTLLLLVLTVYGIWNLDFFRLYYSPFCIHPQMSTMKVVALDYVIAVYPLVLILITYVLVELHDRHCKLVAWLWKPFHYCLARFRRQWDIRASLLDAFVSFFLLSSVKFLNVTLDLLVPMPVHNVHGRKLDRLFLFSDGSIEYFGEEHCPYGILALAMFLVFTIFPIVLLMVYPCRCFQSCLNRYRLRCQVLHAIMDVFQGCYKNGTNGTPDCRYFAAVYPTLRLLVFVEYAVIRSVFVYPTAAVTVMFTAMLVAVVRPYRYPMYNGISIVLLLVLASTYTSAYANAVINSSPHFLEVSVVMIGLSSLLPFVYGIILLIWWLAGRKRLPLAAFQWLKSLLANFKPCRNLRSSHNSEDNSQLEHTRVNANRLVPFLVPVGDEEGQNDKKDSCQLMGPDQCKKNYGTV